MAERIPIRIILVDDHDLVRAGIRALLERLPHVTVVGEARNGQEALRLLRENHPDIAFVDISMPGFDGLTLIRRASSIAPHVRLIVLSMYSLESYVSEALEAGASGYLLKQTADLTELNLAIQCVIAGGHYLTPTIGRQVMEGSLRSKESVTAQSLTPRQREILKLIGNGHGTKSIAHLLEISVKTVETHRSELMERLGIHDVAGLVRYAIQTGMASMEDTD